MTDDLSVALDEYFRFERAFESAWRWFRRNSDRTISLSDVIDRVMAKCPGLDRGKITSEIR